MPYRKTMLVPGEIYHIFNRSVARLPIFFTPGNFARFLELVDYYHFENSILSFSRFKKIAADEKERIVKDLREKNTLRVDILAFCLLDNHYHFLLRQITEKGISKFISNIQNGYAKYFNIKTKRSGPLFQPMFKAVRIETDEQFLHVSRYIHLNPTTNYLVELNKLNRYPWSSLNCYLENNYSKYSFLNTSIIFGLIKSREEFKEFVYNQAEYQRELGKIKHLILE